MRAPASPSCPGVPETQRLQTRDYTRPMSADDAKIAREAARLTQPDWLKDVASEDRGRNIQAEISNAMVGLKNDFCGKGPTKAKTFLNDNYVFCVMEGGLTRNEETLLERGHEDLVRSYRLRFQEAMEGPTVEAVEQITGSAASSDTTAKSSSNPERAFEIFVLDRPAGDSALASQSMRPALGRRQRSCAPRQDPPPSRSTPKARKARSQPIGPPRSSRTWWMPRISWSITPSTTLNAPHPAEQHADVPTPRRGQLAFAPCPPRSAP